MTSIYIPIRAKFQSKLVRVLHDNFFPLPLIRVLSGSILLLAVYGCVSCKIIAFSQVLGRKFADLNWLSSLIDNLSSKAS